MKERERAAARERGARERGEMGNPPKLESRHGDTTGQDLEQGGHGLLVLQGPEEGHEVK
jgi:hypothetical protein